MENIIEIVEREVNKMVNVKLTKYAEHISNTYGLSLSVLLQDLHSLENLEVEKTATTAPTEQCLGITKSKKRCKRRGKKGGYCESHINQKPIIRVQSKEKMIEHTHTLPPMFLAGCPACMKTRETKKKKLLIDF